MTPGQATVEAPVELLSGTNTLTVKVKDSPGGSLQVSIFSGTPDPRVPGTDEIQLFGPETIIKPNKPSVTETFEFEVPANRDALLYVTNNNDVTEATVSLNGHEIIGPDRYNKKISSIELAVQLVQGTNTLVVAIDAKAGAILVVTLFVFDEPPTASFTASPTSGTVPLTVSFDASGSMDPDNDITSYSWNFGDGNSGTGVSATNDYLNPGTYTAILTVTDAFGLSDQTSILIEAQPANSLPVAAFTASPTSGTVPFLVSFDASGSTDPDNDITSYDWNFGDGFAGTGVTIDHLYNLSGPITVTLTVTGSTGLTDQTTTQIDGSAPPTISITSPNAGAFVIQNRPPIQINFTDDEAVDTASLSFTANGQSLAVSCTLDTTFGTCTPTEDLPEGDVTLAVSISDLEGATGNTSIDFFVDSVPVEVAILSPQNGTITKDSFITVTGSIGPTVISLTVNGVDATITGSSFTASVPLREGSNMLVATGLNVNNKPGVDAVDVTQDLQNPIIRINSPGDGFVAVDDKVTVTGIVNDIVDGGVVPTVAVNGQTVPVVNDTFVAVDLQLARGPNTIEAKVTDGAGNEGTHSITVNFQQPAGPRIRFSSGNGQTATVGQQLTNPLTVLIGDELGNPIAGRLVRFEVTRNNGTLTGTGVTESPRIVSVPTNGSGLASVQFTLGTTAGGGNNRVKATSLGVAGEVEFCATGLPGPPSQIIANMGMNQRGGIGLPAPMPFEILVVDTNGNPVSGVDVTFQVIQGGGNINNLDSWLQPTDANGVARSAFTLGFEPGINNNVVTADFSGLTGLPATFTVTGLEPGDPANTTFTGVVLDNAQTPIPGAVISVEGGTPSTTTDAEGQFELTGVPVGPILLHIDPSGSSRPETFPPLEFETFTVAGNENILGQPILIPPIDTASEKLVGGATDVILEMAEVPGVQLKVFANSATFPDGSSTGTLSISQVHLNKVPMPPPDGVIPSVAWTLQPAGVHFDPPAQLTLPNSDGLLPGSIIEIYQFDHDIFEFVSVGRATVSEDGLTMTTDPGFGVSRTGWGAPSPPPTSATCSGGCNDNNRCTDDGCENGFCNFEKLTEPQTIANGCKGCINGTPIKPKTKAQCCRVVIDPTAGGRVACCNGNLTACVDVKGTHPNNNIFRECLKIHEQRHFSDLTCPNDENSPNPCGTTRPDFPQGEQPQAECDAYAVEVACLQAAQATKCNGDIVCEQSVEDEIEKRKNKGNEEKPGCFPQEQ